MNLYSYNSNKVAAIDTLGLETQTCCPKEIIADFSTFTPYQDANLEDLDDELREEWRNNPQYDFEDAALTSSYRKRHKNPYPVDENDASKSKSMEIYLEDVNEYKVEPLESEKFLYSK